MKVGLEDGGDWGVDRLRTLVLGADCLEEGLLNVLHRCRNSLLWRMKKSQAPI